MQKLLLAGAAAAILALPLPASAETQSINEISAQTVRISPGGVRIGDDHRRWESRRARRFERRCRTVTETRETRRGVVRTTRRICD